MGPVIAFSVMCLVWGLTWLPLKVASAQVPPVFLAGARFTTAGLVFLGWSVAAGLSLRTRLPGRLAVSILLITVCCYTFLFWGVAHAPTGLSAIVNFALIPVFTIAIGALQGEEAVTRRRLAAIALGVVGLALLFSARIGGGADGVALGLASVVVGTLCYAWGAVISRPLVRDMAPVALAAWQTFVGGLGLFAVSFALERPPISAFSDLVRFPTLPSLAFLVIGGSLVGFTIYLRFLRDWGAFRAGLYAFVSPVIAVVAGVAALGEPFGAAEAAGAALMFCATAVTLRKTA